ncbi:unnamed protein product [Periconia digitata]|uniref:Uncharacterized protein n=1 Tax=Periconia digitata TaxID=1303443 RepID=A0A9W4UPC2_9PLEO|nr:unnamed protein product [Periconia digitata]
MPPTFTLTCYPSFLTQYKISSLPHSSTFSPPATQASSPYHQQQQQQQQQPQQHHQHHHDQQQHVFPGQHPQLSCRYSSRHPPYAGPSSPPSSFSTTATSTDAYSHPHPSLFGSGPRVFSSSPPSSSTIFFFFFSSPSSPPLFFFFIIFFSPSPSSSDFSPSPIFSSTIILASRTFSFRIKLTTAVVAPRTTTTTTISTWFKPRFSPAILSAPHLPSLLSTAVLPHGTISTRVVSGRPFLLATSPVVDSTTISPASPALLSTPPPLFFFLSLFFFFAASWGARCGGARGSSALAGGRVRRVGVTFTNPEIGLLSTLLLGRVAICCLG